MPTTAVLQKYRVHLLRFRYTHAGNVVTLAQAVIMRALDADEAGHLAREKYGNAPYPYCNGVQINLVEPL